MLILLIKVIKIVLMKWLKESKNNEWWKQILIGSGVLKIFISKIR